MGTKSNRDRLPGGKKRKLPAEPTEAEPGTAEKLRVLAERFRRRQVLWHPSDRKREG